MDDTISRRMAIDALADYIHDMDKVYSTGKLSMNDCKDAAYSVLGELPSAQPEIKCIANITLTDEQVKEAFEKARCNILSAQPEWKKGKWIERESGTEDKENGFDTVIVCSCCDFPATTFYSENCESRTQIRTDFCPNCGADMRGETDE